MAREKRTKRIAVPAEPNKCPFCEEKTLPSYKDYKKLSRFLSERAKILGSVRTGTCAKHQRMLTREIKRARYLGLLPFTPKV